MAFGHLVRGVLGERSDDFGGSVLMVLDAKRLNRRLGRREEQIIAQQGVIFDLLEQVKPSLTGPHPSAFSPVELLLRDNAPGTSVAFSSLAFDNGIVGPEFQGVLKETEDSIVFVKDFKRVWFQQGFYPEARSRQEAVEALKHVLEPLPRPWRFVGSSAGGTAALYFGAHLEADSIHAFSPQSLIDERALHRFTGRELEQSEIKLDDPENDLKTVMKSNPLKGHAFIYYAEENKMDARQAARLREFPNVTIETRPGKSHHVAYLARKSGELGTLLERDRKD